ncbi:two-component system, chemotaxis family, response regulator CheB [Sphingomonas sp. YR710]|uniref:chemotaxis-specific protein-glutamate methyltransferase CheB n=1 Tax=Sphingomonas sp. YR710 TaxID=1882773 RepID=UPI00088565A7|nr:chemotaxis-specific protein-glutamate methyltransferase CheB [Sphingomonas sp. YR710]SDC28980.1 two-component system, chemotaxis family, response regulator CheB [Sphingomonas sp. YR710]
MTRLLIVDDSPLMRRLLGGIFAAEGDFEIETARNGTEALDKLTAFSPDVVTLDIHMPGMDGLACLDRIMVERPCPVVMVSSLTAEGAAETLEALSLGAVAFVEKPSGPVSIEIERIAADLVATVRAAATARLSRTHRLSERLRKRGERFIAPLARISAPAGRIRRKPHQPSRKGIVLVGSSTGGPPALDALLAPLPADFPWPIVVAQHMPATFTKALAARLDRLCALSVVEVSAPVLLDAGTVYVGRGDADLILVSRPTGVMAMAAPADAAYHWHPSVDRLVSSAMAVAEPESLIGVLMTGMGADGAEAMTRLYGAGGQTIAEAEDSAVVWGMPGALVKAGGAGFVVSLRRIAARLIDLVLTA